ncbi:hypothetical protein [Bradyrhizobium sp.]|uniref:hypothetical protein n=1 Tax=Bradyrhizobium sp. TaxID=376 RepID=UPI003C6001C7
MPTVFSLSKTWKVDKLMSAISSSPRTNDWFGSKLSFCGASVSGMVEAAALPASEKVNPAAPSAGTAAFAMLFRFEACFTRDIVASSIPVRPVSIPAAAILRKATLSRKPHSVTIMLFYIQFPFILMNEVGVILLSNCHHHRSTTIPRRTHDAAPHGPHSRSHDDR